MASWVDPGCSSFDDLLALTPAGPSFLAYRDTVLADEAVDTELVAACRGRMATLLGHPDGGGPTPTDAGLDERTAAALAFTEAWLLDPSMVTDDDCARLRAQLSDAEAAAFTFALSVVEAQLRVELALGVA